MMTTQPEALRLAEIQSREWPNPCPKEREQTATELRRLHALNAELLGVVKRLSTSTDVVSYGAALHDSRAVIAAAEGSAA